MQLSKKAKVAIAGGAVVAVAGSGVAYAYWSTSGSGTGTASTSAGASNLTLTQTAAPTNLAPGSGSGYVAFSVKNNADNNAYVNAVTVSIASVDKAANAPSGTCDASDYRLNDSTSPASVSVKQDLAKNGTFSSTTDVTLSFYNKSSNQDACKGATVNLAYASN